ncbi:MAG: ATP-binding protein [Candidatus Marinimicrobia bacterium]|nr:ATP-binding protein [Candidatus Neomarinimicrobiota bacterium]
MDLLNKLRNQDFEIKHIVILFVILVTFQIVLSFLNKFSINKLLNNTLELYKVDSAERIASLTTNSLELILENSFIKQKNRSELRKKEIIEAFNIHFGQQKIQNNIEDICIIVRRKNNYFAIDEGQELYQYFFGQNAQIYSSDNYQDAIKKYQGFEQKIKNNEVIHTSVLKQRAFDVFVPFTPIGEYKGVVYFKIAPALSNIKKDISNTLNETSLIFTALILFGLLAMFYITSYTVQERDKAKESLIKEREEKIKKEIAYKKEVHFTKRIYHAHHKAEKIMGFIISEVKSLTNKNIDKFKYTVTRYANFVSRVIYEMKWKDPPIHAIRGLMFNTNLNNVIEFLVNNIFMRLSSEQNNYRFALDLDENLPHVHINEYVVWEILEPLMQNSIDHNQEEDIIINVSTKYYPDQNFSKIIIRDNGRGIPETMLAKNSEGIQKIFCEHTSNKEDAHNRGYGCYIAHKICRNRCGWKLRAENLEKGCQFIIIIPNN